MKQKKAALLVAQGVQDEEYIYPYYRLQEAGFDLDVILSPSIKYPNPTCKYGIPIQYNITSSADILKWERDNSNNIVLTCPYDILIVTGGWQAPEIMRLDSNILTLIQKANDQNKIIGAICHGPQVLISAKVVDKRRMTCYTGIKDDLQNAGAIYVDQDVVEDRNFVTAPHYKNNPEFMKAILNTYNDVV